MGADLQNTLPWFPAPLRPAVVEPRSHAARDLVCTIMANLVTLCRLFLLFVLVGLAYVDGLLVQLTAFVLLIVVFVMDAVDGWVARRRGETSLFGSVFDIAADRVVENVLWVVLADLDRVGIWVPLVFLVRGFLVDSIRTLGASEGQAPFAMMSSSLGRYLVAGRFMRGLYGAVKTVAFAWLFLLPVLASLLPDWWPRWSGLLEGIGTVLVLAAVALCIARGIPVVVEFMQRQGVAASGGGTVG